MLWRSAPRILLMSRITLMAKIKVEKLQPGMVSAADIKNMDGMLLLPAGCELTERHALILKTWGITEVAVESADGQTDSPESLTLTEISPERLNTLKARFWQYDETNLVHNEILRLIARRDTSAL